MPHTQKVTCSVHKKADAYKSIRSANSIAIFLCVFVRGIKCRNQLALFACLPFFAFAKHENKKRSRVATNLMSSSFNVTPLDAD